MGATYLDLLTEVLELTESTGATEVTQVAKRALVKTLKYIARKGAIRGLIRSATYQWQSTDTAIDLGVGGFGVTDYDTPYLLMVGDPDETPVPYVYVDWKDWLVLRGYPGAIRYGLDAFAHDMRPDRCFTVNLDDEVEISPVVDDKQVELLYFVEPAPYADATEPEVTAGWRDLMVDGAVLIVRQYISDPNQILDYNTILSALDAQITQYRQHLESTGYRRNKIRLAPSYNHRLRYPLK